MAKFHLQNIQLKPTVESLSNTLYMVWIMTAIISWKIQTFLKNNHIHSLSKIAWQDLQKFSRLYLSHLIKKLNKKWMKQYLQPLKQLLISKVRQLQLYHLHPNNQVFIRSPNRSHNISRHSSLISSNQLKAKSLCHQRHQLFFRSIQTPLTTSKKYWPSTPSHIKILNNNSTQLHYKKWFNSISILWFQT